MGHDRASDTLAPKEVFKTGKSFKACDGLVASGSINGVKCSITVDTGSNVSIIRPDILIEEARASLQPVSSHLKTVTGATAPILGCGKLKIQVGAFETQHEMWVAEVADECILGLGFME